MKTKIDPKVKKMMVFLDKIYSQVKNDTPPITFNRGEHEYNLGLYQGQLKALERVSREVFGIDGDELKIITQLKGTDENI